MPGNAQPAAGRRRGFGGHRGHHGPGGFVAEPVKDTWGILKRLWKYLSPYKFKLLGVVLLVMLNTGLMLLCPYLLGIAIDRFIAKDDMAGLARVTLLLGFTYLLAAGGMWLQSISMIRIAQNTVKDIRADLFRKLQTLPLKFFDSRAHGELMSRLTNDTDTISTVLGDSVVQFIGSVLSITGAAVIMFKLNWKLALFCLITVPFVILITKVIGSRTRQGFLDRLNALGELNGIIEETIQGQRVIKVCRHENQAIEKFSKANVTLKQAAIRALILIGLMGPLMNFSRNLGFAIVAAAGGWMVVKGMATVGLVAAFINYSDNFSRPINQLANLYGAVQSALAGAERIFEIMDEESEKDDVEATQSLPTSIKGEVEFCDVCFSYTGDVPILKNVSFHVDPGQNVAIVGPTGAGKTTIINLLTRFYDVDSGCIKIDGRDIRSIPRDTLRRMLGIVLQDTYLFSGTVRENILYGRLDATDEEVINAAKLANADGFIRHLPNGYDTMLTDSGSSLSQGQRQLLAIARTLLANPAILILDEATSNVDTRTEVHIQQAMQRLMSGRTSFIIAHRLSTIRQADTILVIQDGQVAERGKHQELLAKKGIYYSMYSSQILIPEAS